MTARSLIVVLTVLAVTAGILAATAGAITINGMLGNNPSPDWPKVTGTQNGRVTGSADTPCGANTFPGQISAGVFFTYDAYTFANPSAASVVACVTVTGQDTSAVRDPNPMQSNAYSPARSPSYDTGSLSTNWVGQESQNLGDITFPTPSTYRFNVAAGANFVVAVNARQAAPSCSPCTYTLTVDTDQGPPGPPTAVTLLARSSAIRTPRGVLVRWRTASEANELGFNVYRLVAGKRVKVNRSLLPSVFGGTATGHAYSFVDRSAPRVGRLRYWIQDVSLNGARAWHGPLVAR